MLTEFKNYPNWNPFIKSIRGETFVGGKLETENMPSGRKPMKFKTEVLVSVPNQELRWLGSGPITGLFDGEHYFKIREEQNGSVRFEHGEIFRGILVGMMILHKPHLKKPKKMHHL